MGMINTSDLQPGMVIESNVVTDKGVMLLQKGTRLTERHLQIMKTWGIKEAAVEGISRGEAATQMLGQIEEEERVAIEAEVNAMFAGFEESEVMNEAARVLKKIKITHLLRQK